MSTISERAAPQRTSRQRPQPQYIARAKVPNGWVTIGAAWPLRSGEDGFSLKLTTIPLNWDGRFILLPPLGNEEVGADAPDEPELPAESSRPRRRRAERGEDPTV
jgi:hypothetical protein